MNKTDQIINFYHQSPGVHSFKELIAAGGYSALLKKLISENILEEVSKGFYRLTEQEESEHAELETIAAIVPQGVFCLFSALEFHGIGTQKSFDYHLAIPCGKRAPQRPEFSIHTYIFCPKSYGSGIEQHGSIKVYSIAKTVADCFKFRNQIGLDVALEALKDVLKNRRATVAEIMDQAKVCRMKNVMMPYLESYS
jgi:predicted transcriptional regulator of viral defense system